MASQRVCWYFWRNFLLANIFPTQWVTVTSLQGRLTALGEAGISKFVPSSSALSTQRHWLFSPFSVHVFYFILSYFLLFRVTPAAYGSTQARGWIGAAAFVGYAAAIAMWDPGWVCNIYHNSQQHRILNPLSKARDWTWILTDIRFLTYWASMGTPGQGFLGMCSLHEIHQMLTFCCYGMLHLLKKRKDNSLISSCWISTSQEGGWMV